MEMCHCPAFIFKHFMSNNLWLFSYLTLLLITYTLFHHRHILRIFLLSDTFPFILALIHMHLLQEVSRDTLWSTWNCKPSALGILWKSKQPQGTSSNSCLLYFNNEGWRSRIFCCFYFIVFICINISLMIPWRVLFPI